MKVVFMPINERVFDIIVSKSDLLIEDKMPECLLNLISHIVVYKAVIKNWDLGNTTENTSIINFPMGAQKYIFERFDYLKKKQYRLIHGRA